MGTTETVVSLDYGFCKREEQDTELLTVLVIHDRRTKSFHAVPTKSKAGQSLRYLVTELVRFVSFLGHREVCFRSDDERPILAFVEPAKRACRHFGIKARSQSSPIEDREANGAVEQAWKQIRSRAGILVTQVEEKCGAAGKTVFGVQRPLYMWSLLHVCATGSVFNMDSLLLSVPLAAFMRVKSAAMVRLSLGTFVLGPKWQKGTWLGKTTQNDVNILATDKGIFLTRSVRRIPGQWDLTLCGEVITCPLEHGYGCLGGRMILNKKVEALSQLSLPEGLPEDGVESEADVERSSLCKRWIKDEY